MKADFIFDSSLVLDLPLSQLDGTSFMDKSAYGHLCTATGALWTPSGRSLNGTSDSINNIGLVSSFPFVQNTGKFTLLAWVKLTDYTAAVSQAILANSMYGSDKGFGFTYHNAASNQRLRFLTMDGAATQTDTWTVDNVINDNNFHLLGVTGDGATLTFYVDTQNYAGSSSMGTLSTGDATYTLNIGRYVHLAEIGFYLGGTVDKVRIYNRLLTPSEILRKYIETKWRYQ